MSVAIVTGGTGKLGSHIAKTLADQGYDIALHYHKNKELARSIQQDIQKKGVQCSLYAMDFFKDHSYDLLIKTIAAEYESISLLIHSASLFEQADFFQTDQANFERHFQINLHAPFFLSQSFARIVKSGQILYLLDSYITKNSTPYCAYLLSKKSLLELMRMTAVALAPDIRVNAVAPGLLEDPNLHEHWPDLAKKKQNILPLQALPNMEQITHALLHLIQNPAYIGQCLYVDGGEALL